MGVLPTKHDDIRNVGVFRRESVRFRDERCCVIHVMGDIMCCLTRFTSVLGIGQERECKSVWFNYSLCGVTL